MTTTIDRAEINRRNSLRSTGPRSPEGKQRSKLNAVKHGMSAATPVLPGEDPDAFRDRLDAWAEALAPGDVVEQFLVERAATPRGRSSGPTASRPPAPPPPSAHAEDEQQARRREEVERLGEWLLARRRIGRRPGAPRDGPRAILAPGATARGHLAATSTTRGRSSTAWRPPPRDAPGCSSAGPSSAARSSGARPGTRTSSSGPSGSRGIGRWA